MPLQPPPTLWQILLQILGLIVRVPIVILIIILSGCVGYIGSALFIKVTIWIYHRVIAPPW